LKTGFIDIYNFPEITDYETQMERCVIQGDLDGFRELLPKYNILIQELTLKYA
jgi:hypothetical protein